MSPVCCCHSPALICAQERCPFSVQPSPRRNFKHSNLTDYLPASKFSEKTEKCVSCGVVLPAALPCTCCLQPGSWWQFLLLSPNPSALAVSLSLGQLPVPQGGHQGPSPPAGALCFAALSGRCCVKGQGKRNLPSCPTHLSEIPVPSAPTWHFLKGSGGVFFFSSRTGRGGR